MTFFGLFKSKQQRDTELKIRVRQGTMRIHKFVGRLSKQADDYAALARRAFDLDDQHQFRQLAGGYLQCRETINRWERYLVKLKALELRRHEAEATQEFLSSMNALTWSILNGVKPEDISMLSTEMEAAMQRSEELEEVLADSLEDAVDRVDGVEHHDINFLRSAVSGSQLEGGLEWAPEAKSDDARDRDFWTAIEREKGDSAA